MEDTADQTGTSPAHEMEVEAAQEAQPSGKKKDYFKQKVALFFGYNGKAYKGLQKQKDLPDKATVESNLEIALLEAGLISKENYGDLRKLGWQRCSRTDKGVHAAFNGVNLKINILDSFIDLPPEEIEIEKQKDDRKMNLKDKIRRGDIIALINKFLTKDIRCYSFKLVTKKFDVKMSAFSRKYEYLCPLKMFYKYDKESYPTTFGDDEERNADILNKLKAYIKKFVGTRNYHNFTRKGVPKEKTNLRYILSMEVERIDKEELRRIWGTDPKTQYVIFRLHGQSFIYHQIRKMIGSLIQIFQEEYDDSFLDNAFTYNKTPVWLAPSQGLLLDRIYFTAYNKKEDSPESLELAPEEDALIENYKREVLYRVVLGAEEEQKIYTQWMTAGREFNALQFNKDPNFMSHWCNEDMEYDAQGTVDLKEIKFRKPEKGEEAED